ncbi:MAG: diacylglycerol kinase [Pseudomonadales bacterium]
MSPGKYFNSNKSTGLAHLANAVRFSCQGLVAAFQREAAFRHELAVIIVVIPAGIWLARSVVEFAALIGVCMLVLVMELFNSAVEALIDRMGEEPHALAGLAKDYGSAAVMISMFIALIVWASLLFQRLQ